jgi:uncharacterized protein (TIGR02453 family)
VASFAAMAFRGWPVEAIEFFEGLEADNSKAYWQERKEVYERCVKAPMEALLEELAPDFGPGRLFRPYRDVRFSKDKTPYKTNIAALVGESGYVSLSSEALGAGGGMVHLMPDQLQRYRAAVDDEETGTALEAAVAGIRALGHECGPHEALKTAPRGYAKDHQRIELLRAKGIIAWHQWPPGAWLGTRKAKDRVADVIRASEPLHRWLREHVGPPAMETDR